MIFNAKMKSAKFKKLIRKIKFRLSHNYHYIVEAVLFVQLITSCVCGFGYDYTYEIDMDCRVAEL